MEEKDNFFLKTKGEDWTEIAQEKVRHWLRVNEGSRSKAPGTESTVWRQTENNLNSYYSHQALKKENDNSSFINRGPAQGPMAMPGCGSPALQGHGCREECWRWAGRARAGGALAARLKGRLLALLGQPRCGSQARQGGKGFQILPSPGNMDSAEDATWAHASGTQPHL